MPDLGWNKANIGSTNQTTVAYFTMEDNPRLAKPPLNFKGSLAELGVTSLVKQAYDLWHACREVHSPSIRWYCPI